MSSTMARVSSNGLRLGEANGSRRASSTPRANAMSVAIGMPQPAAAVAAARDRQVQQRRHHHAAERGQDREGRHPELAELPGDELALDLQPTTRKNSAISPSFTQKCRSLLEVDERADAARELGAPTGLVGGLPRGVRPHAARRSRPRAAATRSAVEVCRNSCRGRTTRRGTSRSDAQTTADGSPRRSRDPGRSGAGLAGSDMRPLPADQSSRHTCCERDAHPYPSRNASRRYRWRGARPPVRSPRFGRRPARQPPLPGRRRSSSWAPLAVAALVAVAIFALSGGGRRSRSAASSATTRPRRPSSPSRSPSRRPSRPPTKRRTTSRRSQRPQAPAEGRDRELDDLYTAAFLDPANWKDGDYERRARPVRRRLERGGRAPARRADRRARGRRRVRHDQAACRAR